MATPIDDYLATVVSATRTVLSDDLVACYAVGSLAAGDAQPGRSDVDVIAITATPPDAARRRTLADTIVEVGLRCPWAGIEYVLYAADAVATPRYPLPYELNVNSGPARAVHVSLDGDPQHWFLLDVAMARQHAVALHGPPSAEVLGEAPRDDIVRAVADAVAWHAAHEATSPDAVLNACRSWCYLVTGRWASKTDAAGWTLHQGGDTTLVQQALRCRGGAAVQLDADRVRRLLLHVAALATGGS